MYQISSLDNSPKQQIKIPLENNRFLTIYLEYRANQQGWFFDFTYNETTYTNLRLVTAYNMLRAYGSYLPFGLRCDTLDGLEPTDIDDFSSGYAKVYTLTSEDVEAVEANYYAKI